MENNSDIDFFDSIANEIINNEKFLEQKKYIQHGTTTVYDHVYSVAKEAYRMGLKKKNIDLKSLIRGALLHDFFLYDWHILEGRKRLHGYRHPRIALDNARKYFEINELEANIIRSHMWPLTFFHIPLSREAWIVNFADTKMGIRETLKRRD